MAKVIKVDKDALRLRWKDVDTSLIKYTLLNRTVYVELENFIYTRPKTSKGLFDMRGFNFNAIPRAFALKDIIYFDVNLGSLDNVDFSYSYGKTWTDFTGTISHCNCVNLTLHGDFLVNIIHCNFEHFSVSGSLGKEKIIDTKFLRLTNGFEFSANYYKGSFIQGKKFRIRNLVKDKVFYNCNICGFFKPLPGADYIEIYGPRRLMKRYINQKRFLSFHPKLPRPVRFVNCDLTELNTTHFKIDPDVIFENCKLPESIEKTLKPGKYKWWNPLTWLYDKEL